MSEKLLLFDISLRKIEYLFRWSGMHLRNRENYNVIKSRVLYAFNFTLLIINCFGAFFWFMKQAAKGESLISLTYAAPTVTLGFLSVLKSLSFMWYHDCVDKLVYKLRKLETKAESNIVANKALVEEPINFLHFVIKVSNVFNWLLIVAFPLMPLATTAYNFFVLNKVELLLPFLVEYPFDPYDIRVYPFVVLDHIWGGK